MFSNQIAKTFYRSLYKSIFTRYVNISVNFVFLMVLSRTFTPQEFGIIAALNFFYLFFQILSEGGLNPALINLKKLNKPDRDGLFTITFLLGLIFSSLFYILLPQIAAFYDTEEINNIGVYFSLGIIFIFLNSLPLSFLQRETKFFQISIGLFFAEIISSTSAIFLIYFIEPVQALAAKITIHTLINFLFCYFFSIKTEFKNPLFGSNVSYIYKIISTLRYQYAFSISNFFTRNLDTPIVAKFFGTNTLAIYDRAYLLMKYPIQLITFALTPAIQPIISKISENTEQVLELHNDFILKLSIIASAAGIFCFAFSEYIVLIILGDQWIEVIQIFKVLSVSLPIQIIYSSHGGFFQGTKNFSLMFKLSFVSMLLFIFSFLIGVHVGDIIFFCVMFNFAFLATFLLTYFYMYKKIFFTKFNILILRTSPALVTFFILTLLIYR